MPTNEFLAEIQALRETIKFLFPYAKKAFDLEVNKYPLPLAKFMTIEELMKRWE